MVLVKVVVFVVSAVDGVVVGCRLLPWLWLLTSIVVVLSLLLLFLSRMLRAAVMSE